MKNTVFIVEDHPLMRRSIVAAIQRETDLTVCGEADDGKEAYAAIVLLRPDIVLTDIHLKSSSGLSLIKEIRDHRPTLPVIAMTTFDMQRAEGVALAAGASCFVAKETGPANLIQAIRECLKTGGRPYLHGDGDHGGE